MALKDQWISVRFLKGIDTDRDEKVLEPGTPTAIENGVWVKNVTIEKRFGTTQLSRRRITADNTFQAISGVLGLSSRADETDLVTLTNTDEIMSYDATDDAWVKRGNWANVSNELTSLPRSNNERWDASTATIGNVRIIIWQDARDGVHAQMFTLAGVAYGSDFRVGGATGRKARVLAVSNVFQIYYLEGTVLSVAVISPAAPASKTYSTVQLHATVSSSLVGLGACPYDVCTHPLWTTTRLAVSQAAGTYVAVIKSNGVIGTSTALPPWPNPITIPVSDAGVSVAASQDGVAFAVGIKNNATGNTAYSTTALYANSLTDLVGVPISLDADPVVTANSDTVRRHSICFASGTQTGIDYIVHAFLEMSASKASDRYIRHGASYTSVKAFSGSIASGTFRRHAQLSSKAFTIKDHSYIWTMRPSTLQATEFLYREDGLLSARSRPSLAVADVSGCLPEVDRRGDNTVYRAVTQRDMLPVGTSGSQFTSRHIGLMATSFQPSASWRPVDIGGVMHMPGGLIGCYDGANTHELGFMELVDSISGSAGSASLGRDGIQTSTSVLAAQNALATASYIYAVVPESQDSYGNRYLGGYVSLLRMPLSASTTQVQNTCSLTWPTITHTMKDGTQAPDIRYAVYRSGPGGVVMQRIDDPAFPVVNSTASDYVTWVDNFSESTRAAGEVIYTVSENMNVLPSSGRLLTAAGDRLYLAGIEDDPDSVAVSKLRLGGAIAFQDGALLAIDVKGGPITAIGAIDDKLVIFKRARILASLADGPSNAASDSTPYPQVEAITSDVGAKEPAVVFNISGQTEQGLAFESERSIRMLDRSMAIKNIGSLVREYDPLNIVAGLSPRYVDEARFYTSEGKTIVFNTKDDLWSTFEGQTAVAATNWNGTPTWADSDGFCYVEDRNSYRDGDAAYPLRLTLGWMSFTGLQGMARVRSVYLLGEFKSPHTLRVEMAVDYRDSWRVVKEIATSGSMGVDLYGGIYGQTTTPQYTVDTLSAGFTNGDAHSTTQVLSGDGYLQFTTTGSGAWLIAGLASTMPDHSYTTIDNGWELGPGTTQARAIELGSVVTTDVTYTSGDVFKITRSGTTVTYSKNGTVVYTSLVASIAPLYVKVTGNSGTVKSVIVAPSSSPIEVTWSTTLVTVTGNTPIVITPYGGADTVYQHRFDLPVQRFQAVRFRISDTAQSGSAASYSLTEMKLLVSVESGRPGLANRKRR